MVEADLKAVAALLTRRAHERLLLTRREYRRCTANLLQPPLRGRQRDRDGPPDGRVPLSRPEPAGSVAVRPSAVRDRRFPRWPGSSWE